MSPNSGKIHDVKAVSWPQAFMIVALALILMTGVVLLALFDKDVVTIFAATGTIVIAIAAAFGVNVQQKLGEVKDVANGRLTDALERNQQLQEQITALAMMAIPPEQRRDNAP